MLIYYFCVKYTHSLEPSQHIRIAVDAIVFGYSDHKLYVLFIKQKYGEYKDKWVLPGGFVKNDEPLIQAVHRELQEEAGITVNYLEQLNTFGDDVNRDKRFRVISVAYMALVDATHLNLTADTDASAAEWFDITAMPALGYDHEIIVQQAIDRLKNKLTYQPVGFDLLPDEFLFSDLENLYMSILNKEIDRRNFRKKILGFGFIEETARVSTNKSGRPAKYYRFNVEKYTALQKKGFHFDLMV